MTVSKVFPGDEDAETKLPTREWFERRKQGWTDEKPHRHVQKGVKPLYSFYKGQKLNYVESRKTLYCPMYENLVRKTKPYQALEKLVSEGTNIQILGYDGYKLENTFQEYIDCPNVIFGHELVLCAMLSGQKVWY